MARIPTAGDLEKADEEHRKAIDAAIDEYHRASGIASQTYLSAIRKAEEDYKKALEPINQVFADARHKADEQLQRRMSW